MNSDTSAGYYSDCKKENGDIYKKSDKAITLSESQIRKKKYNKLCLIATIAGVIAVLAWGVFSAVSKPDDNAMKMYGNENTVQESYINE